MSTKGSHELVKGQPALSKEDIEAITEGHEPSLDVLVVGMNPSLSRHTYKQLYERLKKRNEECGLLKVLDQLCDNGGQDFVDSLDNEDEWKMWVKETFSTSQAKGKEKAFSELQYYFVEGKEKPSQEKIAWPVVRRNEQLDSKKTITYFDTIRRTLAAGLEAKQSNVERHFLTWYQIDLFHERETDQADLLKTKGKRKEWNDEAEDAVEKFWKHVGRLNPKVLLVANSTVSDLIFTNYDQVLKETFNIGGGSDRRGFGKELFWDRDSFSLRIKANPSEQIPKVVFSRQLSGGASNAMLYNVAKEIGRMLSSAD